MTWNFKWYPFSHRIEVLDTGYWTIRFYHNGLAAGGKWVSFNDVVWC